MLNRLMPEEIAEFWPIIRYGVVRSVPPTIKEKPGVIRRILAACLSGELKVWVSYQRDEETKTVDMEAISLTQILYDSASDTKSLLLFSLYAFKHIDDRSWAEAFNKVSEYGKSLGCSKIVCYTKVDKIREMAELFNADMSTFISFDIT